MRRHISCLIIRSFARMRSRRVFLLSRNFPERVLPQMKVEPRKLKVPGLPCPRASAQPTKIAKPTGSKLVKGPVESEKFVRWKSMKNSEENS
jgi:hypothetical protein